MLNRKRKKNVFSFSSPLQYSLSLLICLCSVVAVFQNPTFGQERQVAITFDDLPVAQSGATACEEPGLTSLTKRLLAPFQENEVPLTAFVIGGRCSELTAEQRSEVLKLWIAAGAEVGNHTYSHRGLNNTPIEEYEQDILRADTELKGMLGLVGLRYFRSPMLQTGPASDIKQRLEQFLRTHGYEQSPVTLDNSDWMFSSLYSTALARGDNELAGRVREAYIPYMESVIAFFEQRSIEVVGREFPQILLVHANRLNAEAGSSLLAMLKNRAYQFISLGEALQDLAYSSPNDYAGRGGFSWIHRWSMTKGMPNRGEPEPPDWIVKEYERLQ